MIRDLAAKYYSHFFFGSHAGQLWINLSEHAPGEIRALVDGVCGPEPTQECLGCLYESLCRLAEDEPSIATEACSEEVYLAVSNFLSGEVDRMLES